MSDLPLVKDCFYASVDNNLESMLVYKMARCIDPNKTPQGQKSQSSCQDF